MYHANKLLLKHWLRLLISPFLLSLTHLVQANGVAEYGDASHSYEVHYSVVNSGFLQPNIAKAYDIIRSPNVAIVNIAVRRKRDVGTVAAIARISGHANNLLGQKRQLDFSEVREQDAIYYIAQFRFGHKERLSFDLELIPDMRLGPVKLKFSKEMYIDGKK